MSNAWFRELIDKASKEAVAEIRKTLGSSFHDLDAVDFKSFRETLGDANAKKMQIALDRWADDGGK